MHGTAKAIALAVIVGNIPEGIMLRYHPVALIPLFVYELSDAICEIAIYTNLGLSKKRAVLLRLSTDFFIPITATVVFFAPMTHATNEMASIYADCLYAGALLSILLTDLCPLLWSRIDEQYSEMDIEAQAHYTKKEWTLKQSKRLFLYLLLAFGCVTTLIIFIM